MLYPVKKNESLSSFLVFIYQPIYRILSPYADAWYIYKISSYVNLIFFQNQMSQGKEKKVEEGKQAPKQNPAQKKAKQIQKDAEVLKLLEEDEDDFQQFEEGAYESNPPTKIDAKQWRQDWDDEDINDEFTQQLKRQLQLA